MYFCTISNIMQYKPMIFNLDNMLLDTFDGLNTAIRWSYRPTYNFFGLQVAVSVKELLKMMLP